MRIQLLFSTLLMVSLGWLMVACQTSTVEPVNGLVGYEYFPLQKGRYIIYDVDSTTVRFVYGQRYSKYQLKELVSDSFPDIFGNITFKIIRYIRPDADATWRLDSVWTASRTASQAVKTENNVPFVKMIFPLKNKATWDGNRLNPYFKGNPETYTIGMLGESFAVGGTTYPNVVQIIQAQDSSLIDKNVSIEYYAEGIGLIYKQKIQYNYRQDPPSDSVITGGNYHQRIITHGKE